MTRIRIIILCLSAILLLIFVIAEKPFIPQRIKLIDSANIMVCLFNPYNQKYKDAPELQGQEKDKLCAELNKLYFMWNPFAYTTDRFDGVKGTEILVDGIDGNAISLNIMAILYDDSRSCVFMRAYKGFNKVIINGGGLIDFLSENGYI